MQLSCGCSRKSKDYGSDLQSIDHDVTVLGYLAESPKTVQKKKLPMLLSSKIVKPIEQI